MIKILSYSKSGGYSQKRVMGKTIKMVAILWFLIIPLICYWFLRNYSWNFIADRVIPYGIPPLLSLIISSYCATIALRIGQNEQAALIFSLFCFLNGLLGLDILLNCIVTDKAVGLELNRLDHIFFVFAPALLIHLTYLVVQNRRQFWVVYGVYAHSLIMSPLSQTSAYFYDMHTYYWGFIAKSGLLFDWFGFTSTVIILFCVYILIKNYHQQRNRMIQQRIFYLAIGISGVALITLGNVPAIKGYEFYPIGNFTFIPLCLTSYGMFKHNLKEALNVTRIWVFWLAILTILLSMAWFIKRFMPTDYSLVVYFMVIAAGLLAFFLVYRSLEKILFLIFGHHRKILEQNINSLMETFSRSQSIPTIYNALCQFIFKNLLSEKLVMLFIKDFALTNIEMTPDTGQYFFGWESWNPQQNFFTDTDPSAQKKTIATIAHDASILGIFEGHKALIDEVLIHQWVSKTDLGLAEKELLVNAALILPVFFQEKLICLILLGNKIDGCVYSEDEKAFLQRLGIVLGPSFEHAKLVQNLEAKVTQRTRDLEASLRQTQAKEQEIAQINQFIQIINSTLDLDEVMLSVSTATQQIFDFDQMSILLVNEAQNALELKKVYGKYSFEQAQWFKEFHQLSLSETRSVFIHALNNKKATYIPCITPEMMQSVIEIDQKAYQINPIRALLIYPMKIQNKTIGIMCFGNTIHEFKLSTEQIEKVHRLVIPVAAAINNARLIEETQQALWQTKAKEEEIAQINQMVQIVNSTLDFDTVAASVMSTLRNIFDFDAMAVMLLNDQNRLNIFKAYGEEVEKAHLEKYKQIQIDTNEKQSITHYVMTRKKPIYVSGLTHDTQMAPSERKIWEINPFDAALFLPLQVLNRTIGIIVFLVKSQVIELTDIHIENIRQYMFHIATAINNALLTAKTNQALTESKAKEQEIFYMNQVIQAVNSTLDLDKIMTTVMDALQEIFSFNQLGIFMADLVKNEMTMTQYYGRDVTEDSLDKVKQIKFQLVPNTSFVCETYLENRYFYVPHVDNALLEQFSELDRKLYMINPVKSYLLFPLEVQNQVIGTIVFADTLKEFQLTDAKIKMIQQYVSQIATTINNARLYNELHTARNIAEAATQAKSDFLANISHEIRTPLNGVIGLTELMLETEVTPQQKDYLQKVSFSARSLLSLINDILDFSKIEAGMLSMENINFNLIDVLDNIDSFIKLKAEEKGLNLKFDVAVDVPCGLIGDPLRLGQILLNLLSNAVKFSSAGSIVTSITRLDERDDNTDDPIRSQDHDMLNRSVTLKFCVTDSGIGISHEQIKKLFQKFTQADSSTTRRFGGTGLGLVICKHLVEMFKGTIWVDSEPGRGSTFSFTARFLIQLPKSKDATILPKTIPDDQGRLKSIKGARVLLAEDNEINQQIASELLEKTGFIVDIAGNGLEALRKVATHLPPNAYDAILMDLQMPEMDGYEACRRIRNMSNEISQTPIIAMTAHALDSEKEKCLTFGMNDHIAKPIEPDLLYATLIKWISADNLHWSGSVLENLQLKPELALPDSIPGLDIEAGLFRCGGNQRLYVELLNKFRRRYHNGIDEIQKAVDASDFDQAAKLIHTLRGAAANLGAKELSRALHEFENIILQNDKKVFDQFANISYLELKRVIDSIDKLSADSYEKLNLNQLEATNDADDPGIIQLIDNIVELIGLDYAESVVQAQKLEQICKNSILNTQAGLLVEYLDNFEEAKALSCLEEMSQTLSTKL